MESEAEGEGSRVCVAVASCHSIPGGRGLKDVFHGGWRFYRIGWSHRYIGSLFLSKDRPTFEVSITYKSVQLFRMRNHK